MSQGIGIRYSTAGARIVGLERSGDGFTVTGIAAGPPGENIESFITGSGFSLDGSVAAVGLCPGDFISASIVPEEGMDTEDLRAQLRWEIERKMVSGPEDYVIDYAISDLGFIFAAVKNRIAGIKGPVGDMITDVETVALFNGCDAVSEIGQGIVVLVSAEAEGISSLLLKGGELMAMESFPVREESLLPVLSPLDREGFEGIGPAAAERFTDYIAESFVRITKQGDGVAKPEKIIIAGAGVLTGDIASMVAKKTGITATVCDPFEIVSNDIETRFSDFSGLGPAFTTCFGLAVRALEE